MSYTITANPDLFMISSIILKRLSLDIKSPEEI